MLTVILIIALAHIVVCALCKAGAPASDEERRLDDEAQIEYLNKNASKHLTRST